MEEIELTESQLLEAIKEAGIDKSFQAYIKNKLQAEGDRRLSEGLKTYQKNQDKKNLSDGERLIAVEAELIELKDKTNKENAKTLIEAELVKQDLSKGLSKYIKIDSNDPSEIEKSVTDLKDNLLKMEQERIDLKLKEGEAPPVGEKSEVGSILENYIKNGSKTTSPFKGKISESEGEKK
ncbi:hypothetical protein ES702_07507 [subsurface metagenome]